MVSAPVLLLHYQHDMLRICNPRFKVTVSIAQVFLGSNLVPHLLVSF